MLEQVQLLTAQQWDRVARLCAEFLRETGVLLFAFGMLDPFVDWIVRGDPGRRALLSGGSSVLGGAVFFAVGLIVEVRRIREDENDENGGHLIR